MKLLGYDKAKGEDATVFVFRSQQIHSGPHLVTRGQIERFRENFINALPNMDSIRGHLIDMAYGPYYKEKALKEKMMVAMHKGNISHIEYKRVRMKAWSFIDYLERTEHYPNLK